MSRFFRNGVAIAGSEAANSGGGAHSPETLEPTQENAVQEGAIFQFSLTASQVLKVRVSAHTIVLEILQSAFDSPVHPLLHLDRFIDATLHQGPRLWPSLVLASNILTSAKAYQYIHAMIFGRRTIEPPKSGTTGDPVIRFWRNQYNGASHDYYLQNAEAEKIDEILEETADEVRDAFWDLGVTREGLCSRDGKMAVINSRRFYGLLDLTGYPELVLRKWLNIASTLLHKLMHALSWRYCIDGTVLIEEMVFENDEVDCKDEAGEVGWAFERFVFGSVRIDETMTDTDVLKFYNQYLP